MHLAVKLRNRPTEARNKEFASIAILHPQIFTTTIPIEI
jgi:hypothetical protein